MSRPAARRPGDRPARIPETLRKLRRLYPDAGCSLDHAAPFELLVATILSAQCTDARVNMVTPELFRAFPDPESMAAAPEGALEEIIRSTGFFNAKARALRGAAGRIVALHGGAVPGTMEALVDLPGVGRKTANVVLGNAFGAPEGVVVDTHVGRLARRLGWSKEKDPVKVEADLNGLVPRDRWVWVSHALILHGRAVCGARKPDCASCALAALCPRIGVSGTGVARRKR